MVTLTRLVIISFTVVLPIATASAHSPVDFLEVFKVEPARMIDHAVELKSKFDADKVETKLVGPRYFSQAVGCLDRPPRKPRAYLNWFEIVEPRTEPIREVSVLDMVRGKSDKSLRIKSAEYFLSPSQLITTGVPDSVPSGLDHYKAYRIVDATSLDQQVTLTDSSGSTKRRIGRPLYLCLPVSEWHHDESFAVSHPSDCFVVYELDKQEHAQTFSTIDQFGLNEMRSSDRLWICVCAALLNPPAE